MFFVVFVVINPRNPRLEIDQMRRGVRVKPKFFENFFTPFLTSSYENRVLRIEDFFQSNAQVRLIVEGVFFSNRPEKSES